MPGNQLVITVDLPMVYGKHHLFPGRADNSDTFIAGIIIHLTEMETLTEAGYLGDQCFGRSVICKLFDTDWGRSKYHTYYCIMANGRIQLYNMVISLLEPWQVFIWFMDGTLMITLWFLRILAALVDSVEATPIKDVPKLEKVTPSPHLF